MAIKKTTTFKRTVNFTRPDPDNVDPVFNGVLQEVHQCPACGNIELRRAP